MTKTTKQITMKPTYTFKQIKNEQWQVNQLLAMIDKNEIDKPKFQRPKKWTTHPEKENAPNEKAFIEFLYENQNSVHPISFGSQPDGQNKKTNIDGNNRINAISHYVHEPFALFPEYLDEVNSFIDSDIYKEDTDFKKPVKEFFKSITYTDIINFKYKESFIKNNGLSADFYNKHLQHYRDAFEVPIEKLQSKMLVNGKERFDTAVKINVNIFEGYSTNELCKTFGDINKYNSKLTETELLACRLHDISNFQIGDTVIKAAIQNAIKLIYHERTKNEALVCYEYNETEKMNAYDFIIGFQNYMHTKCRLIEAVDNDGLTLFFKIYKTMYKGDLENTFTSQNVNDFIGKILNATDIIDNVRSDLSMTSFTGTGNVCAKMLSSLKKNNMYLIMSSVVESDNTIIPYIKICLVYHFLVDEISCKEKKKECRLNDTIKYDAGGSYIDSKAAGFFKDPSSIANLITREHFSRVLDILLDENIQKKNKLDSKGKKKRRNLKFYEKLLMNFYYHRKVPTELLAHKFWIEHIVPYSSQCEEQIDIDRLGNTIPIIEEINRKRSNSHISEYTKPDSQFDFMKYITIIPSVAEYDKIVDHSSNTPKIINHIAYNEFCVKNETTYKQVFLDYMFPKK
jgi:hypothetical protein